MASRCFAVCWTAWARQGRQVHIKPLVTALKAWFEERLKVLSGKSLTAEAIRYGLNLARCPGAD